MDQGRDQGGREERRKQEGSVEGMGGRGGDGGSTEKDLNESLDKAETEQGRELESVLREQ